MVEQLQIVLSEKIIDREQPSWQKPNELTELIKKTNDVDSGKMVPHKSDYFTITDSAFPFMYEEEQKEGDDYESFTEEMMLENLTLQVSDNIRSYSLIEQFAHVNFLASSTRFAEDIIFSLMDIKLFKIGAACLSAAVAASMFFLPDGFNIGASLVLSAPLFVCVCGIFAKYVKRSS